VKLNVDGIDKENWVPRNHLVTGLEVRTRVRCGDHRCYYSHDWLLRINCAACSDNSTYV